ncbi:MAG: sulfur carrier protein ThiS [Alphaproteobacteria bacterium]|nr:sulfur carrier protein ThiS [Alphaproteobacteria bacterium]
MTHSHSHREPSIALTINGAEFLSPTSNLGELLQNYGIDRDQKGVAVALNGVIVAKPSWSRTEVNSGDVLEILAAIQGG